MVQVIWVSSEACRQSAADAFNQALYLIFQPIPTGWAIRTPSANLTRHFVPKLKPHGSSRFVTNVTEMQIPLGGISWFERCISASLTSPGPLSNMFSMQQGSSRVQSSGRNTIPVFRSQLEVQPSAGQKGEEWVSGGSHSEVEWTNITQRAKDKSVLIPKSFEITANCQFVSLKALNFPYRLTFCSLMSISCSFKYCCKASQQALFFFEKLN